MEPITMVGVSSNMRVYCLVVLLAACGSPPKPSPPSVATPLPPSPAPSIAAKPAKAIPPEKPTADSDEIHRPCHKDSVEHREVSERIRELDTLIKSLKPADDPVHANKEMALVFNSPCFVVGRINSYEAPYGDSALAVTTFWEEGGKAWMQSIVDIGDDRSFYTKPTMRKTLAASLGPKHALAPLVCPQTDKVCGVGTVGWMHRVDIELIEALDERPQFTSDNDETNKPRTEERCAVEAMKEKPSVRMTTWMSCVETLTRGRSALPLGRMKVPTEGWLVVRGRRGHYSFCDEVRLYDMAAGSAYVAKSCSGLALTQGGGVHHGQTNAGRKYTIEQGSMSLDNIREAAWLTLLSPHVEPLVLTSGTYYDVPKGIDVAVTDAGIIPGFGMSFSSSSAQTTLAWSYILKGKSVASGTLTWPNSYNNAAENHAVDLLWIAEGSFKAGCPTTRVPKNIDIGTARPGVSGLDARPDDLSKLQTSMLANIVALPRCKGKKQARRR